MDMRFFPPTETKRNRFYNDGTVVEKEVYMHMLIR